jgi:hypothetical protein
MRLAWHQHFAFHEYKDLRGNRLFAGHSTCRLAQFKVGEGKVPDIMPDIRPDIIPDRVDRYHTRYLT